MTAPKPPQDLQDIYTKIAALQTHAESPGATEQEAMAFAAKAQELLQRYDLSMSDVSTVVLEKSNPLGEQTVKMNSRDHSHTMRSKPWQRRLAYDLGHAFYCETLTSKATATFIGRKDDVELATHTYQTLLTLLDNMARLYTKTKTDEYIESDGIENKNHLPGDHHPSVVRNSYLDGAVTTITKQFNKQSDAFIESSKKASALVVSRQASVKEHAMNLYKRVYKKKGYAPSDNNRTNWDAYADGKKDGEKASVSKAIKAPKIIKDTPAIPASV